MPRTIIDVPDQQLREVDQICRMLRISRAEAVRRGISEFIRLNSQVSADGFGLWKDTRAKGTGLIATIRSKW